MKKTTFHRFLKAQSDLFFQRHLNCAKRYRWKVFMSFRINWYPGVVHREYLGRVSNWDLLRSSLDVYSDARFDKVDLQIIDFAGAQKLNFSRLDLQKIDGIERAAQKSNWTLRVSIVFPDYIFDDQIWFVKEYGKETKWCIQRHETLREVVDNLGGEISKQLKRN